MGSLSDYVKDASGAVPEIVKLPAGAAITKKQLLFSTGDGKAYPLTNKSQLEYINMGQSVGGYTDHYVYWSPYYTGRVNRGMDVDANGQPWAAMGYSGHASYSYNPGGIQISRWNGVGSTFSSVALETGANEITHAPVVKVLANGNVAALWGQATTAQQPSSIRYGVVSNALPPTVIKTSTNLGTPYAWYEGMWDMIPLSGGGFAIAFNGNDSTVKLGIYDNNGNVVTALATIWTGTGSVGAINVRLVQFANGNIGVVIASQMGSSPGLYAGVYSAIGAVVTAIALKDVTAIGNSEFLQVDLIKATNRLCVFWRYLDGTFKYRVFDETATAIFASTNIGPVFTNSVQLLNKFGNLYNDGTHFYVAMMGSWAATTMNLYRLRSDTASSVVAIVPNTSYFNNNTTQGAISSLFTGGKHVLGFTTSNSPNTFYYALYDDSAVAGTLVERYKGTTAWATTSYIAEPGLKLLPTRNGEAFLVHSQLVNSYHYGYMAVFNIVDKAIIGIANSDQPTIGQDVEVNKGQYIGDVVAVANIPAAGFAFNHSVGSIGNIKGTVGFIQGKTVQLAGASEVGKKIPLTKLIDSQGWTVPENCTFEGNATMHVANGSITVDNVTAGIAQGTNAFEKFPVYAGPGQTIRSPGNASITGNLTVLF